MPVRIRLNLFSCITVDVINVHDIAAVAFEESVLQQQLIVIGIHQVNRL